MFTGYKWKDKASSTNITLVDKIRTFFKLRNSKIKYGRNVSVKQNVEIRLTDNAILEIGDNVIIDSYVFLQLTKPTPKVILHDYVGIGRHCVIAAKGNITIGKYTQIGPYCQINDQGHAFKKEKLIIEQDAIIEDVTIGEDCWIGAGVRILKGVRIGNGVVIGAGAIVNKNIPDYEIWAGVPAKFIKKRL
ncbi:MAG: transferase [Sulfuricurvum sp. PD_MW2]|jgi:acetyltransferase-like isoleucine patch superfamily enzyme|uniref:acyltransferase n=1 Tax=Sulfuricurvum sp. PD_MW2 TaxID=2027917 RepID=UPI000C0616E9|nr:acyltransferase [Sulfuricurvum sp. PD_MW2]PHM16578.1 MAG: transferase [Sulfuricurvum sp. PD_MW2]